MEGSPDASSRQEHALVPKTRGAVIYSRENEWMKSFRTALQGTGLRQGGPIGIEGTKLVIDAIGSGLEVEALLVSDVGERNLERILLAASDSQSGISRQRILRTTDKLFGSPRGDRIAPRSRSVVPPTGLESRRCIARKSHAGRCSPRRPPLGGCAGRSAGSW